MSRTNILPEACPEAFEPLLKLLGNYQYESRGFPVFILDFVPDMPGPYWQASYRNPVRFDNPDTKSERPYDACKKLFDFLKAAHIELFCRHVNDLIVLGAPIDKQELTRLAKTYSTPVPKLIDDKLIFPDDEKSQ